MFWVVYRQTSKGVTRLSRVSAECCMDALQIAKSKYRLAPYCESLWVRKDSLGEPDVSKYMELVMPEFRAVVSQDIRTDHSKKVSKRKGDDEDY